MVSKYKNIHFIGIGGAGMSGLAYVLVQRGYNVTGSDIAIGHMADALQAAGAKIFLGHKASQIDNANAVVVSTAIHPDNPELIAAKIKNIPVLHRSDVLAGLLNKAKGIAIAGAHGKSTTSAMTAVILAENEADPTIVIGGEVASLHGNSRNGHSEYVVAEADESDGSFLKFYPYIDVITNIEDDHLDHYGTEENIYKAFKQFVTNMQPDGTAVLCMDNPKVRRLASETDRKFVTYGLDKKYDYSAENIVYSVGKTTYDLYYKGKFLTKVTLIVPGRHNVLNSLGAFAAARIVNIPVEGIVKSLGKFGGVKRRFETKGKVKQVWVVDDYAHHPTEIAVTLKAAKQTGAKRIVCVFQPHRYTRTKILHAEFCQCFKDCDLLILTHIFSAGEDPIPGVSSRELADAVHNTTGQEVVYIEDFNKVNDYLLKIATPGDIIMTMGAGDVYTIGEKFLDELKNLRR
jgi:UDP-N-acetylmuramate--alanine ligase